MKLAFLFTSFATATHLPPPPGLTRGPAFELPSHVAEGALPTESSRYPWSPSHRSGSRSHRTAPFSPSGLISGSSPFSPSGLISGSSPFSPSSLIGGPLSDHSGSSPSSHATSVNTGITQVSPNSHNSRTAPFSPSSTGTTSDGTTANIRTANSPLEPLLALQELAQYFPLIGNGPYRVAETDLAGFMHHVTNDDRFALFRFASGTASVRGLDHVAVLIAVTQADMRLARAQAELLNGKTQLESIGAQYLDAQNRLEPIRRVINNLPMAVQHGRLDEYQASFQANAQYCSYMVRAITFDHPENVNNLGNTLVAHLHALSLAFGPQLAAQTCETAVQFINSHLAELEAGMRVAAAIVVDLEEATSIAYTFASNAHRLLQN